MAGQLQYIKMAKANVVFSKDNEYYTPKKVVDYFFPDGFDYDPATCKQKAEEFGINNYDTIDTDGLTSDWTKFQNIWINPPFTEKHKFIEKAYETYKIAKNNICILFPIEFLTTKRFHDIAQSGGGLLYIPSGRINFESGLGKKGKSPAFGSCVLKIQDTWEIKFLDIKELKEK